MGRLDVRMIIGCVALTLFLVCQLAILHSITHHELTSFTSGDGIHGLAAARRARWELWPFDGDGAPSKALRVGLVSGGSSDLYGGTPKAYGDATGCLLRLFAQRRGYALYIERAMQRLGLDRPVAWQKIRLLAERLADVDLLVWIDADVAWTASDADLVDTFLRRLSTPEACVGNLGQERWTGIAGANTKEHRSLGERDDGAVFLWVSADVRPKQTQSMNLNTAMIALRAGDDSRRFLDAVWAEGDDPESFHQHNRGWRKQPPGHHYYGWPFEQGGIWSVLGRYDALLRRTCVTAVGALHSVQYHLWQPGTPTLGVHMPGMVDVDRRSVACEHMQTTVGRNLERCGEVLEQCPDIYAGHLLAIHARGLCAHCLGLSAEMSVNSSDSSESGWSNFDCSCLVAG